MTLVHAIRVFVAHVLTRACRVLKRVDPEHGGGCGCPRMSDEGGRYEPGSPAPSYHTDYPFFVCPDCWRLTPWCDGCGDEDKYLAECCDECWEIRDGIGET